MRTLAPSVLLAIAACAAGPRPEVAPRSAPPRPAAASADPKAAAPAPRAKPARIRSAFGITEYRLANGLVVLLVPDPTQSSVTVNITYLVGSRLEGHGEAGMAHLLEHMLFKGTARHRNVLQLLEERGAHANGSTWADRTNYYETLTATPENLEFALALEADRMVNALISPEDLKSELSVVRNELESGENDPLELLGQRIASAAYLWHAYGKDTIGSRADIERVPAPALRAFYQRYYQPDNAVLVVSGKLDEPAALATIERTFGAIPRPPRALTPSYTVEPVQDGERSVTLRRSGDVAAIGVAYHTVGGASPDYPAVQAAIDMLVREPSGTLYKKLVEAKLAAAVSGHQLMFRDPHLAQLVAQVRAARDLDRVEQIMIAEIERLGAGKIDEAALERWRTATLRDLELELADSEALAIELSEFAALGDWRTLFAYRERVGKIAAADVRRVALTFFKRSNRTTGRFIPTREIDRAPPTETPDVAAAVAGLESGALQDPGEAFAATLDNIEARTTRRVLAGGIRAALLPKQTRGRKVQLQLALHFGDEQRLRGKAVIAQLMAATMDHGTAKKSYQELQDLQDRLRSRIEIEAPAPETLVLTIETLRDQLPAALDLAAEVLISPSFPDKEIELAKQKWLARLEQQRTDPSALAWSALIQLMEPWPQDDPRHTWSVAELLPAIPRVRAADVRQLHRDLVGVARAELVVVGDFDAAAIGARAERLFGGWRSKQPYARIAARPLNAPAATRSIEVEDREMTELVVGHGVAIRDTDPDYPAWLLLGHLLGGDTSSRLWMRLREKEGLSYDTRASTYASAEDTYGGLIAHLTVAPQNLAAARASLLEEIQRMATGAATADELRLAKESWLKEQDTKLSDDGVVASMLREQAYLGRTTAEEKALRARVQAVTAADLARVARQHLQPQRLIVVDAGDHAKAGAPAPPAPAAPQP